MAVDAATPTGGRGFRSRGLVSGFVLKLARESTGATQQRLAESLGVDTSTVQGWESGRRPLTALRTGDLLTLRGHLVRQGAPASLARYLFEALETDVLLATAIESGARRIEPDSHPLASSVHRRSLTNLLTWPLTGTKPAELAQLDGGRLRRGPVPSGPVLPADERKRLFDHLLTIAERATKPEAALLRRQAVYLLGFDQRTHVRDWLRRDWERTVRRNPLGGGVPQLLERRSASVALASTGNPDALSAFVTSQDDHRDEIANLNYWAYWVGEITSDQTDDGFMVTTDPKSWGGVRLLEHLTRRLDPRSPHLSLNLHTAHTRSSHRGPHYSPTGRG